MIYISTPTFVVMVILTLVLAFLLSQGARDSIISVFKGLAYLLAAGFHRISAPFRRIPYIPLIILVIFFLLLFIGGIYILTAAMIYYMGHLTGKEQIAQALILLFIVYGLTYAPWVKNRRIIIWVRRFAVRPALIVITIVLVVGLAWLRFEKYFPRAHDSISRSSHTSSEDFWNRLDKRSLQSESEAGIFARINEDVYATTDTAPFFIKRNSVVKVTDLNGQKANSRSEGKIRVMVKNKYDQFDGGHEGWVPSRVIDWKEGSKDDEKKRIVMDPRQSKNGPLYAKIISLEKGRWASNKPICAYLDADVNRKIVNDDFSFKLDSDQEEVEIFSRDQEIILTKQ